MISYSFCFYLLTEAHIEVSNEQYSVINLFYFKIVPLHYKEKESVCFCHSYYNNSDVMDGQSESLGSTDHIHKRVESILKYKFLEPLDINEDDDEGNGLYIKNFYFPEELVTKILSFVEPRHILQLTLVCKRWCNIIKSTHFWVQIYERTYGRKTKSLPWYVFYCCFGKKLLNHNLLRNGNGQEALHHWEILEGMDEFNVEWDPCATDPLPPHVPEFNRYLMCFVTNGEKCGKKQDVDLLKNKLLFYIVNKFNPDIYASDWVAVRNDCTVTYALTLTLYHRHFLRLTKTATHSVEFGKGRAWKKVTLVE